MNVAFRVDASDQIGTGHLVRCLTLADALSAHRGSVRFLCRFIPPHLRTLILSRGHEVLDLARPTDRSSFDELRHSAWLGTTQLADANESAGGLSDRSWDWLVADHYALDERWESSMRRSATRIMVIDDLADRNHNCDILLDPTMSADAETRYAGRVPVGCRLLLGPRHALLREEFSQWRARTLVRDGKVKRILVFFGGIDAANNTGRVVTALGSLGLTAIEVDVVIGASHPCRADIESSTSALGYRFHVQTERMAELMSCADLAVGAGGTSTWERCCLGLPALVLSVAENQRGQLRDAAAEGLVYAPDWRSDAKSTLALHVTALLENPVLLQTLSRNSLRAVDGRGVERVLRALGAQRVTVRPAVLADSTLLFNWRNAPSVRAVSRHSQPIRQADHDAWFSRSLANPDRVLLIGERDGTPIGSVRFDVAEAQAEVSIYLAPDRAHVGLGSDLLIAAEAWLVAGRPYVRTLNAEVLKDNPASHGLFRSNGYAVESTAYAKVVGTGASS